MIGGHGPVERGKREDHGEQGGNNRYAADKVVPPSTGHASTVVDHAAAGGRFAYDGRVSGQVLNRRETHKQQTRAALEDAALALFGRKGYEDTTVEEIAAAAGVSVRTFFRYFASKRHALFGDVAYQRMRLLGHRLEQRPAEEDPLDSVRTVLDELDLTDPAELAQIRTRLSLMREQPSLIGTYLMINHELQRLVAAFVGQRSGLAPMHPYPMTVASAASAAWDVALWAWASGSGELTEVRRRTFDQLTAGVTKP